MSIGLTLRFIAGGSKAEEIDYHPSSAWGPLELLFCAFHLVRQSILPLFDSDNLQEFDLLEPADIEPLKDLIEIMESQGQIA